MMKKNNGEKTAAGSAAAGEMKYSASKASALKRLTAVLLAVMMIFVMAGCQSSGAKNSSEKPGTVVSKTKDSITIVDQANREVKVPKKIDSIALCYRVVIRFILSLDEGDKIKGCGKKEEFLVKLQPSLADARDVGQGVADLEALADLSPDVFFHKANDTKTLDSVQELGIPAVGLSFETTDDMITALDIMGKVLGQEKKADKLISYYKNKISEDKKITKNIKNRKTAIVMGTSIGKVADGTMLQGHMIETAGGTNAAKDLKATELWPTAGTEQIFKWDPDYIFITGSESANYTAADIYKDKAWSEMKAVKNRHIYVMPAAEDSWEFPGIVSTLGIDYMMNRMYPDKMSDSQLDKNVREFYKLSYGKTFSRSEIGY